MKCFRKPLHKHITLEPLCDNILLIEVCTDKNSVFLKSSQHPHIKIWFKWES